MQRRPFLFRAVNIKYFKQILFGTFKSHHLTKLSHGYTTRAANEDPHEASGMVHLLRCLEVYSQAIAFFAHPAVESSLHRTLSDYRIRLSELSVNYTFSSIREHNHAFLTARILTGQDHPLAWSMKDERCEVLLLRRVLAPVRATGARPFANSLTPKTTSSGICRKFNEGRCTHEQCKYAHICSICQQKHAANACPKPPTSAMNTTPLESRISRPG